jgi:hypothetical protein
MASFALLAAFSGFRYSAVEGTLWFNPNISTRPFRTFFSTASGFGTITLAGRKLTISVLEGKLMLKKVVVTLDGAEKEMSVRKTVRDTCTISLPPR